jgi:hypothetical protein
MSERNTTSVPHRRTIIERVGYPMFGLLLILWGWSLYQWHEHTELLRAVTAPVDNGDQICDDREVLVARAVEPTPCGQFIFYLINLNQGI